MSQQQSPQNATVIDKGKNEEHLPNSPVLTIPPGFVLAKASNGAHYAAPDFLIPAAKLALETEAMKIKIRAGQAAGGVKFQSCINWLYLTFAFIRLTHTTMAPGTRWATSPSRALLIR